MRGMTRILPLLLTAALGCGGAGASADQASIDEDRLAERVADILEARAERERLAEGGAGAPLPDLEPELVGVDVDRYRVPVDGDRPSRGAGEPLVTVVMFTNFECPFCGRVQATVDRLLSEYPDDVRLVVRNNPLPMHRHAALAHQAALEAYRQGGDASFWAMHDLLFANQRALDRPDLARYGRRIGLDVSALQRALDRMEHQRAVDEDQALAQRLGANGTPHFFINGRRLAGAQPYESFREVVEDEIRVAGDLLEAGVPRGRLYAAFMQDALERRVREPARRVDSAGRPEPDPDAVYRVPVTRHMPQLGPDDALVTIVESAEYECPFCARVQPTLEQVRDRYGNDVRIVWVNNPLPFHSNAMPAAIAAMEVFQQAGNEAFWTYHRTLFDNQRDLSRENLERWAQQIGGVNMRRFRNALDTGTHRDAIQRQQELMRGLGATGTPSFFINGRNLRGAQPLPSFVALIDEELSKARARVQEGTPRAQLYETIIRDGATEPQYVGRAPEPEPPPERYELPEPRRAPRLGPRDAPVVIQMFTDFQCPFCSRVQPTIEQIRQVYPSQVAIVFRHYPLPFHQDAPLAHEAAWEVYRQGGDRKFWAYHEVLFQNQRALRRENLERWAEQLGGIDMRRFRRALDRRTHQARVQSDIDAVQEASARIGTPSFFINGRLVQGAQPLAAFRAAIDRALAAAP